MDDIIHYTAELCIPNRRLERLAKQYQADAACSNSSDANAIESLRRQNKTLSETVRELQRNLNSLNREHDTIAKELIESKMEIAWVHDENDALRQQSFDLKRALEALHVEVESRIKAEMSALSSKNAALKDRNVELEEQLASMEQTVINMKLQFLESENERDSLDRRLNDLKRWCP